MDFDDFGEGKGREGFLFLIEQTTGLGDMHLILLVPTKKICCFITPTGAEKWSEEWCTCQGSSHGGGIGTDKSGCLLKKLRAKILTFADFFSS